MLEDTRKKKGISNRKNKNRIEKYDRFMCVSCAYFSLIIQKCIFIYLFFSFFRDLSHTDVTKIGPTAFQHMTFLEDL